MNYGPQMIAAALLLGAALIIVGWTPTIGVVVTLLLPFCTMPLLLVRLPFLEIKGTQVRVRNFVTVRLVDVEEIRGMERVPFIFDKGDRRPGLRIQGRRRPLPVLALYERAAPTILDRRL